MSIQLKRTTSATSSVVLDQGQPGLLLRTGKGPRMKVGDGTTNWTSLPFITPDIYIYSDNSLVGPSAEYSINCNKVLPLTNGSGVVGSSDKKMSTGWFQSFHISNLTIADDIVRPNVNGSGSIGSSTYRFGSTYSNSVWSGNIYSDSSNFNSDTNYQQLLMRFSGLPSTTSTDTETKRSLFGIHVVAKSWDGSKNVDIGSWLYVEPAYGSPENVCIRPDRSNNAWLGSNSNKFGRAYIDSINVTTEIYPYSQSSGSVGRTTNRFANGYFDSIDVGNIVPKTADSGEVGYGSKRWSAIYSNDINAHHYIVNADISPDTFRGASLGSEDLSFSTASLYAISGYYTKTDATPFLNIFARPHKSVAAADTLATAVQFVTYYKPANGEAVPHYLRFAASSATNCALTFSRNEQTGDTISIGTSSAAFDNVYGNTILPGVSSTGTVGSASRLYNTMYAQSYYVNSIVRPVTNNVVDLGLAGYNFRNAYVYSIRNQSNTGNGSLSFYSVPKDATSSANYSSSMSFELQTRYWSNSTSTILVHRAMMEPHPSTGTAGLVFRQNAASNQGHIGTSSIPWYRVYGQELHQVVGGTDYKVPVTYSGTGVPSSTLGNNGDIYIQYVN